MKLRNKKTGEIGEIRYENHELYVDTDEGFTYWLRTIAELNEKWKDYKPTEPLIKDERIRKAVRAWAEANNINSRHYYDNDMKFNSSEHKLTWIDTTIQFNELGALEGLEDGKRYTVDELCGEEEE